MAITDLLGFAILALAIFMVVTRFIFPYFRGPRLSRKDRDQLIRDAEMLLESEALSDDDRDRIRGARNTLQLDGSRDREAWGGKLPVAEAAETIRSMRARYLDQQPE